MKARHDLYRYLGDQAYDAKLDGLFTAYR